MTERKPLICQNCNGHIDRRTMKCPYCDTEYERTYDHAEIHFVPVRPGVHTIRAMVKLDDHLVRQRPELAAKVAKEQLRKGIADGLLEYMVMQTSTEYSPMETCHIIRGEVRVLEPTEWDY